MEGVYKEGILQKRQRGLRASDTQRKSLRFQKRFCRLTQDSLDYYDKKVCISFSSRNPDCLVVSLIEIATNVRSN